MTTKKIPAGYERAAELAEEYFKANEALRERIDEIAEAKRKAGRRLLPGLKARAADLSAARDELRACIESDPGMWDSPRTRSLHGVKLGMRKLPDKVSIDPALAIPLVRELLPGKKRLLLNETVKLNMKAVGNLKASDLAKIGGSVEAGADVVTISIAKSDFDKLVEALLDELDKPDEDAGGEG